MFTNNTIYLEGRYLTEGRTRNSAILNRKNPHEPRELLLEWIGDISHHWGSIESTLNHMGPSRTHDNAQLRFAVTKADLAAELAIATRKHLLHNVYDTKGPNYNYQKRFDDAVNEFLTLVETMIELLSMRASDLKIPDDLASFRNDSTSDGLYGRIQNLTYARHLADLARSVCWIPNRYEHPKYNDWLKLTATLDRNFSSAIIDRAKDLETFRNARMEAAAKEPSK